MEKKSKDFCLTQNAVIEISSKEKKSLKKRKF
jgi:hypothetical protein